MVIELDDKDKRVLHSFTASGYSIRTASGLSRDAGLTKPDVQMALSRLMANGLVSQIVREDGIRFYLTAEGRSAVARAA